MKKIIFVTICCSILLFTGCEKKQIDFSKYSFTGITWTREGAHDQESIRFNTDGSFSYSCACGNSVNDADLCESYTYNEETKEIKLSCIETTEDTISTIKIINQTQNTFELDFNGEIRIFEK